MNILAEICFYANVYVLLLLLFAQCCVVDTSVCCPWVKQPACWPSMLLAVSFPEQAVLNVWVQVSRSGTQEHPVKTSFVLRTHF